MRWLIRLYPARWRERYGAELAQLVHDLRPDRSAWRIAADLTHEERTGASYYVAKVELAQAEIAKLDRLKLVPGMPVESFTETEQRTALSYFTRPLTDQFTHAFREN